MHSLRDDIEEEFRGPKGAEEEHYAEEGLTIGSHQGAADEGGPGEDWLNGVAGAEDRARRAMKSTAATRQAPAREPARPTLPKTIRLLAGDGFKRCEIARILQCAEATVRKYDGRGALPVGRPVKRAA